MAGMIGRGRTLVRLLGVQATWNYERMQGVGVGFAAEPALKAQFAGEPERYREAVARAAGFFNANPYLTPAAVGAEVRAEADGIPAAQIERLRAALSGPLGALGDRLFWSGLVPALSSTTIALVLLGGGAWPVLLFLVLHNAVRLGLAPWLLALGWDHGLKVGAALSRSLLPRASVLAEQVSAFCGALAVPLVAARYLAGAPRLVALVVMGLVIAALLLRGPITRLAARVLRRTPGRQVSPMELTLVAAALVLLWHWRLG